MKKFAIIACMMVIGLSAFASSLAIPWFVDNAPAFEGAIPSVGQRTMIFLKNNSAEEVTAAIAYFSADGAAVPTVSRDAANPLDNELGKNTFVIAANAAIAFRPVVVSPGPAAGNELGLDPAAFGRADFTGGMEAAPGFLVPTRGPGGNPANGSANVYWVGPSSQIQGALYQFGPTTSIAHLLPPGA